MTQWQLSFNKPKFAVVAVGAGQFVNRVMPPDLRMTWERSSDLQLKTDNQVSKIMPLNTRHWMPPLWYAGLHFSCFLISLLTKIFSVDNAPFKLESHLQIWVSAVFMAECHWKLARGCGGKNKQTNLFSETTCIARFVGLLFNICMSTALSC